jgi:Arc/MetJ-type ribon-helix-helix transcriptional regulator
MAKIAVSVPVEILRRAKAQVKAGRAKSVSALVSEAVGEKVQYNELAAILDEMDATYGKPGKRAEAWARRVIRRSSSTRAR